MLVRARRLAKPPAALKYNNSRMWSFTHAFCYVGASMQRWASPRAGPTLTYTARQRPAAVSQLRCRSNSVTATASQLRCTGRHVARHSVTATVSQPPVMATVSHPTAHTQRITANIYVPSGLLRARRAARPRDFGKRARLLALGQAPLQQIANALTLVSRQLSLSHVRTLTYARHPAMYEPRMG